MAGSGYPYKLLPGGQKSWLSLNNLILENLPEGSGLEKYNHLPGSSLYSLKIVKNLTAEYFPDYRVNTNLIDFLDKRLLSERDRARLLLEEIGGRLGAICLTMCMGNNPSRIANPVVSRADWAYWRKINHLYFAGGMVKGEAGQIIKQRLQEIFNQYTGRTMAFTVIDAPVTPSLLGCALRQKRELRQSLLFDFGHSFIKRGIVVYQGNEVKEIREFIPERIKHFPGKARNRGVLLNTFISDIILKTCKEGNFKATKGKNPLLFTMANNIIGNTFSNRGYYGPLSNYNSDNYFNLLSRTIQEKSGIHFDIEIINDAEAVASLFSGEKNTAVITLGTNLGLGYPEDLPLSNKRLPAKWQPKKG